MDDDHDRTHRKRPDLLTGAMLLAGILLVGMGSGLVFGEPGYGLIIGLGAWLIVMGVLRAGRVGRSPPGDG